MIKTIVYKKVLIIFLLISPFIKIIAQNFILPDSAFKAGMPNSGRLWGNVYGDFYYKAHSDSIIRGGLNQYTGVPQGKNAFAFRRIYLGYDYNITKKFTAELLLAAEDNLNQTSASGVNTSSGDLLTNNKYSFYIKLANIRWKNIWKRTDLVIGQVNTPSYALLTEKVWAYRPIERTIADIRRTPSFDMGITIQSKLDSAGNYGYNLMVGNGTSAKPETDKFKWFYGDVYAMFLNKRIVIDLYADYERLNWNTGFHHARNMVKGFIAFNSPTVTFGIESYINKISSDVIGFKSNNRDTLNSISTGISYFLHFNIIKNKLRYVIRLDTYNPNIKNDNNNYSKYVGLTSNYEPSNKEIFFTTGLDYIISKTVHFIPNIWFVQYKNKQPGPSNTDHDLVYRLTFFYHFGK